MNYKSSNENNPIRTVGIETLISSMYRVSKENYIVYINTDKDLGIHEITIDDSIYFYEKSKLKNTNTYAITINEDNSNVQKLLEDRVI